MGHVLSRTVSAATLGYAVFSLVKPEHLGRAMESDAFEQPSYDGLAKAYGVRDVVIGGLGLLGPSPKVVRTAMVLRIAGDVADCVVLASRAPNARVRTKVLAVTLGYAALNVAALVRDSRSA
jgi:hypothetical protein